MTWARATFRRRLLPPGRRDVGLHSLRHARAPSRATVAGCGDASCGAARGGLRSRPRGDEQPAAVRRRRSQHLLPGNWYKTSPNQFEFAFQTPAGQYRTTSSSTRVSRASLWNGIVFSWCWCVLCKNRLWDLFFRLLKVFLVYHSLGSKIPPYDSECPGHLRVSSLVQAGTPNSTPQTPHRGYLLTEAMIRVVFGTRSYR